MHKSFFTFIEREGNPPEQERYKTETPETETPETETPETETPETETPETETPETETPETETPETETPETETPETETPETETPETETPETETPETETPETETPETETPEAETPETETPETETPETETQDGLQRRRLQSSSHGSHRAAVRGPGRGPAGRAGHPPVRRGALPPAEAVDHHSVPRRPAPRQQRRVPGAGAGSAAPVPAAAAVQAAAAVPAAAAPERRAAVLARRQLLVGVGVAALQRRVHRPGLRPAGAAPGRERRQPLPVGRPAPAAAAAPPPAAPAGQRGRLRRRPLGAPADARLRHPLQPARPGVRGPGPVPGRLRRARRQRHPTGSVQFRVADVLPAAPAPAAAPAAAVPAAAAPDRRLRTAPAQIPRPQPPPPSYGGVGGYSQPQPNYQPQPTPGPYTGPLNTTPYPGCAAALKCVEEQYCTAEGVMANSPQYLTREQQENRVPMSDCQNPETGIIGKCCRDPNYKDPWPGGMMMKNMPGSAPSAPSGPGVAPPPPPPPPARTPFQDTCANSGGVCVPSQQCPSQSRMQPEQGCSMASGAAGGVCCEEAQPYQEGQDEEPTTNPNLTKEANLYYQAPSKPTVPGPAVSGLPQNPPPRPGRRPPPRPAPQPTYAPQPPPQPAPQPTYAPQPPPQPAPQPTYAPQPPPQPAPQPTYAPQPPPQPAPQPTYAPQPPPQPAPQPTYAPQPAPQPTYYNPQPAAPKPTFAPPPPPQPAPQPTYAPQPSPQPSPQTTFPSQPPPQPTYAPAPPSPAAPQPSYSPQPPPLQPLERTPQPQQPAPELQPPQESPLPPLPEAAPTKPSYGPQSPEACGQRRQVPRPEGLSPGQAAPGEYPWQAIVASRADRNPICGAAVLSKDAVITAAHCVHGMEPSDLMVIAGEHLMGVPDPGAQETSVAAIARHPDFNPTSLFNDHAVLRLAEPLTLGERVGTVCLPEQSGQANLAGTNPAQDCVATGWGLKALKGNHVGSGLNAVPARLMAAQEAEQHLRRTFLGPNFRMHQSQVCALATKPETTLCMVDPGGPLACPKPDGAMVLAGVYSWDVGCHPSMVSAPEGPKSPTAFSAVDADWVRRVMAEPIQNLVQESRNEVLRKQQQEKQPEHPKPGFDQGYGK
ncbi:basic proline-rich protein-like [Thrips palmi]|uniref:Basic proline-rich protein-like n=1 Tax=Thrips palmi TaxID=161013 RepID=A0A6P8ZIQ6_THRPL|nr:basic proline-rich protein-like [Thrips palmi]